MRFEHPMFLVFFIKFFYGSYIYHIIIIINLISCRYSNTSIMLSFYKILGNNLINEKLKEILLIYFIILFIIHFIVCKKLLLTLRILKLKIQYLKKKLLIATGIFYLKIASIYKVVSSIFPFFVHLTPIQ